MRSGKCTQCNKEFNYYASNRSGKFCGVVCSRIGQDKSGPKRRGEYIECIICGNKVYRHPSRLNRTRCSWACANKFKETMEYSAERLRPMREGFARTNHSAPDRLLKRSEVTKKAYAEGRLKPRYGATNNLWKGGIASDQNKARATAEYKAWRKAVYERDRYSCVKCGTNVDLHAHHIKSFSKYPELRTVINNGITVCRTHHGEIHGRELPNIGVVRYKMRLINEGAK